MGAILHLQVKECSKMSPPLGFLVVLAVVGSTIAFTGEFVPKSFYTIDENGHKSDVIYLRKRFAPRYRRSAPGASYGGGGAITFDGPTDIAAMVQAGLGGTFQKLKSLADEAGAGGGFSGGFSGGAGGLGGHGEGPVIYSRFAEGEKELVTGGNGRVHASASASGPNGGVSFSSSSVDSDGNVRYKTHAQKF